MSKPPLFHTNGPYSIAPKIVRDVGLDPTEDCAPVGIERRLIAGTLVLDQLSDLERRPIEAIADLVISGRLPMDRAALLVSRDGHEYIVDAVEPYLDAVPAERMDAVVVAAGGGT